MDFYVSVNQHRNDMLVVGYKGNRRLCQMVPYEPYVFVPALASDPTTFKDLSGKPVKRITYKSISDCNNKFFKRHCFDEDFEWFGTTRFAYNFIYDHFPELKPDPSKLREAVIDIEVDTTEKYPDMEKADCPITAITLMFKNMTLVWGLGDFTPDDPKIKYKKCADEREMLKHFLDVWEKVRPDVLTGWNIEGFDIPYIVNRMMYVLDAEETQRLSPFGVLREYFMLHFGRRVRSYKILGVVVLDYMAMYKKFTYHVQESYSLNHICWAELGERKTDYTEYENLAGLYLKNHQLFMEYNVRDCALVWKLDDKLKFLALVYEFAYDSKVNMNDALGSVMSWDTIINNYLMDQGVVVPGDPHAMERYREIVLREEAEEKGEEYVRQDEVKVAEYHDTASAKKKRSKMFLDDHLERVEDESPVGGHVKDPIRGMYDWVVSFDLQSLYPHLIMAYNISPECALPRKVQTNGKVTVDMFLDDLPPHVTQFLKEKDVALAANGSMYKRDKQGFLAALMEDLFAKRKVFKNKMLELKRQQEKTGEDLEYEIVRYDNLQKATKVKLNSAYGALANKHFRWYSIDRAESITMSGQLVIRTAERELNKFLNEQCGTEDEDYIIASDTDSCYINFGVLVKKVGPQGDMLDKKVFVDWIDAYCKDTIQPFLDKVFAALAEKMNCYKQTMFMKRESISDRGIFVAKKRYVLHVHDNEDVRYAEPELKLTGIEAVRSTTPAICRDAIRDALQIVMTGTEKELQDFVAKFKNEFMNAPPEDIAFPKGMNGLDKFSAGNPEEGVYTTKRGAPIHVRGATIFNRWLINMGLQQTYSLIFDKEKVKYWHLKMPNPTGENVIAALNVLPHQFELAEYIDRDMQFEKSFLKPLQAILTIAGLKAENDCTFYTDW